MLQGKYKNDSQEYFMAKHILKFVFASNKNIDDTIGHSNKKNQK